MSIQSPKRSMSVSAAVDQNQVGRTRVRLLRVRWAGEAQAKSQEHQRVCLPYHEIAPPRVVR